MTIRRISLRHLPEHSADKPGDRRQRKIGRAASGELDDGGDAPAVILPVTQPGDAYEKDQRRDDRDEEKDVIEIDQGEGLRIRTFAKGCVCDVYVT